MTTLNRCVIAWAGAPIVGTAVTVLHYSASDNAAPPVAGIKAAFEALKGGIPGNVTLTVPNTGDKIDDTTGQLTGVWAGSGGGVITGSAATSGVAAGVGAVVGWQTGGIINGRKLRGRTFIVPLATGEYSTDGRFNQPMLDRLNNFALGLIAAGPLAVWHRPTSKSAHDGNSYGVIQSRVRNHVAYLGSRRD